MKNYLRNVARIAVVSALTAGAVPFGTSVNAEAVHDETNLAGFSVEVEASPLLVLVDDPKAAIPRPTGTAVVEADPNFTLASVSTGPNARAIASTLWPGNLFGEGLPAINSSIPPYPLKAESRYPDKPYTAQGVDGGALTSSSALGLDAFAQADGTPTNKPGQVTIGNVTSTSTATVTDKDVAVGTAVSAVNDVNLLGLIHIGSVTTRLTSSADGKNPDSTGTTTVSGLTIAGQSFGIDEKGLHIGPQNSALPELTSPAELQKSLGITIKAIAQTHSIVGDRATRTASGLVIRIDTAVLKKALDPVVNGVRPIYAQLIGQLVPAEYQGYLFYALNAGPSLTFVFGAGRASSAATLPISFEFPPPPVFPGGPGPGGGTGVPPLTPGGGLDLPSTTTNPTVVPPVLQPPGADGFTPVGESTGFGGISAPWLLGALIGSGLIGWVLMRFLGLAGGALAFGCRLGAPTSVPDLRSVTA
jgi:hypothetical protein